MPSDPELIQDLFLRLTEIPIAERPAALEQECGSDVQLRQRVEALLNAHDGDDSLLDQSSDEFGATAVAGVEDLAHDLTGEYQQEQEGSKRSGSAATADTNIRSESTADGWVERRLLNASPYWETYLVRAAPGHQWPCRIHPRSSPRARPQEHRRRQRPVLPRRRML